ncbi:MAG: ribosome biogenesis GTPase YlqF [Burkholderiales bacterium]|nr:ribosome biogenesis GTPase YlqF [Burkholderiales bacterium]
MSVQWFPGHMNATRKAIAERMKQGIDVVIELLDARLPGSSTNPLLATLTEARPALKLLNKQDLADPARTALWLAHFNAMPETRALPLDASDTAPAQKLVAACRELAPLRGGMAKPLRVLICGIPNVGKSTLINTLVGKKSTKTGDEAGITKIEQRIALASDVTLFDTPGMLWPKLTVPKGGYHLAASGAVGKNAYDEEEVALELLESLQPNYADRIEARYRLSDVAAMPAEQLLEAIGRARGAMWSGGRIHMQKAAEIVLNDFRSTALGRITLETPEEFAGWQREADVVEAERQARKQARAKR